jgi:hypothetical protein
VSRFEARIKEDGKYSVGSWKFPHDSFEEAKIDIWMMYPDTEEIIVWKNEAK